MSNLILMTDSYKQAHDRLDAPRTQYKEYHLIPRGGNYDEIVVFGTQMLLNKLQGIRVRLADIEAAQKHIDAHLGPGAFNAKKWVHIAVEHNGLLPIRIDAIPEGTVVKPGTPVMVVSSTCEKCSWLPGHLETTITRNMWYPTSVATRSRKMRKILRKYNEMTSDGDLAFDFRLHDFGGRSYVGDEAARLGGVAHLAAGWMGTDTIDAVIAAQEEYHEHAAAFSVYATEHSVRTTFGGPEGEEAYIDHVLATVPSGIVSIVGDTFDIYRFTNLICHKKDKIRARNPILAPNGSIIQPATVVLRPDSGDPKKIVPWMLQTLYQEFGGTKNSKGYIVLDPCVRVIQGDGINEETLEDIVKSITDSGFALENVVFGCGTGLMQRGLTRDTLKWAYKGNHAVVDHSEVPMWKDPVTDPGKKSIKGRIDTGAHGMVPVFENGRIAWVTSLKEIRERCRV